MLRVFVASWRAAETAGSVLTLFIASAFREREISNGYHSSDRTYIEDLKNLFEARIPGRDCLFVFLRVKTPRDSIPLTPLDKPPLDICYGPANKDNIIDGPRYVSLVQLTPTTGLSHREWAD